LPSRRRAFTLVELLVALALIIFIMTILSAAFAAAGKSFRDLKAAGDLAEQLRSAMTLLRRDLAAPHFGPNTKKLSDVDFWSNSTIPMTGLAFNSYDVSTYPYNHYNCPPPEGFFKIIQGAESSAGWGAPQPSSGAVQIPATPNNEIPTYVNSQSLLHFTTALPGLLPGDFFSTDVRDSGSNLFATTGPGPVYTSIPNMDRRYQIPSVFRSQFAEVCWALVPTTSNPGVTASDNTAANPPQQLYTLRRRQRLLWPERTLPTVNFPVYFAGSTYDYREVSVPLVVLTPPLPPNPMVPVNRMTDITAPAFRWGTLGGPYPVYPNPPNIVATTDPNYGGTYAGDCSMSNYQGTGAVATPFLTSDIVLDNVVSFSVRVLLWDWKNNTIASDYVDLSDQSVQNYNPNTPAPNNAALTANGPWVFDTWTQQNIGQFDYSDPVNGWSSSGKTSSIPLFSYVYQPNAMNPPIAVWYIRIMAVQVILRVYDPKTQTTRQVTLVQDM
jgi:type II secretory pathway pseudopilin PulG